MKSAHSLRALVAVAALTVGGCADTPGAEPGQQDPGLVEGAGAVPAPSSSESAERTGLYVYWADAARFTDCATGRSWPVAQEGASIDLERAHLRHRAVAGEATWVRLSGGVAARPSMEPGRDEEHLVVDSLLDATGETACRDAPPERALVGTRWTVEWLPDVVVASGGWLLLDEETGTLTGDTGCRPLTGSFEWVGTRLRFGGLVAGGGSCSGVGAASDATLLEALRVAGSYRSRGDTLELMGETGAVARLRAR